MKNIKDNVIEVTTLSWHSAETAPCTDKRIIFKLKSDYWRESEQGIIYSGVYRGSEYLNDDWEGYYTYSAYEPHEVEKWAYI